MRTLGPYGQLQRKREAEQEAREGMTFRAWGSERRVLWTAVTFALIAFALIFVPVPNHLEELPAQCAAVLAGIVLLIGRGLGTAAVYGMAVGTGSSLGALRFDGLAVGFWAAFAIGACVAMYTTYCNWDRDHWRLRKAEEEEAELWASLFTQIDRLKQDAARARDNA